MSISGIREVFKAFEEVKSGVGDHQKASFTLMLLLQGYARCVPSEETRELIESLLAMPLSEMDHAIGENYHQALAAGFFFQGVRR